MKRPLALIALLAFAGLAAAQTEPAPAPAPQEPATAEVQDAATTKAKEPATTKPKEPAAKVKAAEPKTADSPLVAAAKKAKGGKVQAGTVITNEHMKLGQGAGGSVTYANPSDPSAPGYTPDASATPGGGRSEEEWKKQLSTARGAVSNLESRITTLKSQAAKLENDFYAWDDPAYRDGVIKPAWDQALGDLEAAKQSLEAAKQRVIDLEEQARKAGAPPGWLR